MNIRVFLSKHNLIVLLEIFQTPFAFEIEIESFFPSIVKSNNEKKNSLCFCTTNENNAKWKKKDIKIIRKM